MIDFMAFGICNVTLWSKCRVYKPSQQIIRGIDKIGRTAQKS